jgi:hypothetical protein
VLRAALGDPSFFSSRKHPVRRFVNRIASLGAAFEDFDEADRRSASWPRSRAGAGGRRRRLRPDRALRAEAGRAGGLRRRAGRSARCRRATRRALLAEKEDELRLRALYAERLAGELRDWPRRPSCATSSAAVWSQVLMRAVAPTRGAAPTARCAALRRVGRELFMSVQPKASPAQRKTFLAELPKLMQELNEGMNLIGWPEAERRAFFGQLMPAHAEALKGQGARRWTINLMARQVEGALERPLPSREELRAVAADGAAGAARRGRIPAGFSAEEAARIGLVDEAAVDWNGACRHRPRRRWPTPRDGRAEAARPQTVAPGAARPAVGRRAAGPSSWPLADNVQIGFAYQMHLEDSGRRCGCRTSAAARSFFIFTHGGATRKTVSLTHRMLCSAVRDGRCAPSRRPT